MVRKRRSWLHYPGRFWLWINGWKVIDEMPDDPKFVLIGAPHTSNWDFPYGLALAGYLDIRFAWMGKKSLFDPPFGSIMRALGGVAVDRENPAGIVGNMVELLHDRDEIILGIAPKGTRKPRECWKSGFYRIAVQAGVPIVCCYLDYPSRTARIGNRIQPNGDIRADMDRIRSFLGGVNGKNPAWNDVVRLPEED